MVELAGHILDRKAGHFDPAEFHDEYELALRKLVKRKAAGHTIEAPEEEPAPTNVINLMDALRESMKRKKTTNARQSTVRKRSASRSRKTTGRRKAS
jgi:DNA end-binding protein Ku